MAPYVFVLAALFLSISIIFIFQSTLNQLKEDPATYEKQIQKFMLKVFLAEIIPVILIVYGFILQHEVADFAELYIPLAILVSLMAITSIFVLLRTKVDVAEEQRAQLTTFGLMAIALANAVPIIGIVALFTMVQ